MRKKGGGDRENPPSFVIVLFNRRRFFSFPSSREEKSLPRRDIECTPLGTSRSVFLPLDLADGCTQCVPFELSAGWLAGWLALAQAASRNVR